MENENITELQEQENLPETALEETQENMQEEKSEDKEPKKKKHGLLDNIIGYFISTYLLTFVGQVVGLLTISIVTGILSATSPAIKDSDVWGSFSMYFSFWGIWAVILLFLFISKKNRPMLKKFGTKEKGNNWKGLLIGLLIGFGLNASCILIAWLHKDIDLHFESFRPISFLIILFAVFVQSSAEELTNRGYLYQKLIARYKNPVVAIVGNSLLFALLHLTNSGVTILSLVNIMLTGILFSLAVYYFDSLWCAFTIHTGWNFTQNIIFGLPNSGKVTPYSVMKLDASTATNSFAYNVGFGVEGTIVADVVLLIACILMFLVGRSYKNKKTQEAEQA